MKKVVIDTSVIIAHLRQRSDSLIGLEELFLKGEIELLLPQIVVVELFAGKSAANKKTAGRLERLINSYQLVELSFWAAKLAGKLIRELPQVPDPYDVLIAAIAQDFKASVATENIKHFEQIKGTQIYSFKDFSK